MKVGSLFTGYGGLDIAVGGDLAWYAEIEPAACQVLAHHYPNVPNLGDITKIDWSQVEPVDVITGGYPCQPFSHAGNRKGKNDVRHLWPNVLDAIRAIRPRYAIMENVSGHLTLGFADVLADLAEIGWACEWGTYRASDVGAPHRRERIFIVAHTESQRSQGSNFSPAPVDSERVRQRVAEGDSATVSAHATRGIGGEGQGRGLSKSEGATGLATHAGSPPADTSGDGHGQQLHARGMAGVEAQATRSPQQRQRTRRESDPGSVDDAANTAVTIGRQSTLQGTQQEQSGGCGGIVWGKYAPAIARWEAVLERAAPAPTIQRNDKRRLNPQFVEWMMGLPDGWVTGHGLSAAKELKMLGNGVVPQQAHAAITQLLERTQQ